MKNNVAFHTCLVPDLGEKLPTAGGLASPLRHLSSAFNPPLAD